jgi:hypothetical protein
MKTCNHCGEIKPDYEFSGGINILESEHLLANNARQNSIQIIIKNEVLSIIRR